MYIKYINCFSFALGYQKWISPLKYAAKCIAAQSLPIVPMQTFL